LHLPNSEANAAAALLVAFLWRIEEYSAATMKATPMSPVSTSGTCSTMPTNMITPSTPMA
jgi:hypothetical protein